MPQFDYIAVTDAGQRVNGSLEADTKAAVLRLLADMSLLPVSVSGAKGGAPAGEKPKYRVKSRDLGMMYGQLGDLIGSGVPMMRSLDSLIKSTVSRHLVAVLREVRKLVADGKTLTEALREFPEVFPPLHTAMVQAGERAAFLEDVLSSLATFIDRLDELKSTVIGSMIYPALLAAVGSLVMIGALMFFVPRFEPLLASAQKPLPTEILFGASHILREWWFLMPLVVGGLGFMIVSALRSESNRLILERIQFKIPVVGMALRMVAITRFCRILGTMLANGVPLLPSLKIGKDATGSWLLAAEIQHATESVREGKTLTEPLSHGGMFPEQILAMITVAEESNNLDKVLLHIADTVERRTNRQIDQAVRLVEPVILCLVAAGIGFMALGLLLPIFTLASALGQQ
ncbi:MAG: general secretion pathway protein F/type IV pilus assembly protein PilC [Limisphaerales bacterium]|jgi:general secretion pathway protein F